VGGDKMDSAIIKYIRRNYNLLIGEWTAEIIKNTIGNAYPDVENMQTIEVRGRDLIAGIPKTLTIDSEEIRLAIIEQTDAIVEAVNAVLEHTPAELAADITEKGIVLTGGGALLKNMDKLISDKIKLPIKIAEDPLTTVAFGAGKVIDSIEILKQVMVD